MKKQEDGSMTVQEYDYIEIIDLIEELQEEPKTTNKQIILKRVANNPLWLKLLKYTYDTSKNYGVRNLDEECFTPHHKHNAEILSTEWMFVLLDKLANRELTGNKAKSEILNFCRNCNDGLQDILQAVLWRDLNIGASAKSFNKAYGKNFIYVFETMSARGKSISYPCYGETKLNGQRLIIEKENGVISFKSRQGKEYHPPYLEAQVDFLLAEHDNVVLDSEIDGIPEEYGETSIYNSDSVRTAVNGHINKFIRNTATEGLDMKFRINVFDMLTIAEFRGIETSPILEDRYLRLELLFEGVSFKNIVRANPKFIANPIQARKFYSNIVSNKGEGAMFKLRGKPYQLGDSQHWVKAKQEVDVELEILGFYKGAKGGKREHTIGGVNLATSCRKLFVNAGSGLKDMDIEYILENQEDLIGRVINVRFNTLTDDKNRDTKSCFLPRFFGGNKSTGNIEASLRDDKDVANTLEEIELAELDAQRFMFGS